MSDGSRPELNWGGEDESTGEDNEKDESDKGLCKVEDPTCEACQ